MTYRKVLVDNATCSRRFHITFDDTDSSVSQTKIRCSYCQKVIFEQENHPPAKLAREENLIKTAELSDNIVFGCDFKDQFSRNTIANFPDEKLYR